MKPQLRTLCRALFLTVVASHTAVAQLINIRTAPVSVGEQFYTFPSRLMGMGGGMALRDLEADPFSNPATGSRINGAILSGTPTLYYLPQESGFGRTMPVTIMGSSATSFGALSLAAQELESAHSSFQTSLAGKSFDRFSHNFYSFGMLGQKFEKEHIAVAISASHAKLDALHMVDLLYPDAVAIDQGGGITDLRLGFVKEYDSTRSLEAVVVRNHVDITHDVTYIDNPWRWGMDPATPIPTPKPRVEHNQDKTTTWGAHLAYQARSADSKWHFGTYGTANTKSHPKIPNYSFSHIPRDPGNSLAFAAGVGAARVATSNTWAFDFAYMPMWTSTWAEAATPTTTRTGKVIPVGGPTIENEFVFSNTDFHFGWMHNFDDANIQLGMNLLHVNYYLDQYDNVNETPHQLDESWTEITLSWGFAIDLGRFEARYFGHHKGGGVNFGGMEMRAPIVNVPDAGGPDIVSAPNATFGAMTVQPTVVVIHQFGFSVPIGRKR
ncbi:MAG TPA: hypothetical protein VM100_12335 [Longimicrobiales bacterium]|nr:hypothetical protein [Longimicrobiales bacterium]